MTQAQIQSVAELTSSVRGLLELHFRFVAVMGEISNLRQASSGHSYFVLKDARAQLRAVLFRTQQRYLDQALADGRRVICRGRISVYEQRGEYQLVVDTVEAAGAGALHLAFEQLKARLLDEGLFAPERKRPLPLLPERLALVTSRQGAVLHDFLRIAQRRCPLTRIAIYPVPVQGAAAAPEIAAAIETINRGWPCDLLVLCRGGGSIEDLWGFNEEIVARAIAASRIPVVSAIGHEVDLTISDMVADLRAPTPSAAAELVLPDLAVLRQALGQVRGRLCRITTGRLEQHRLRLAASHHALGTLRHRLDHLSLRLDHLTSRLCGSGEASLRRHQHRLEALRLRLAARHPLRRLELAGHQLKGLRQRMTGAMQAQLDRRSILLSRLAGSLGALSPLATLARGYAIVRGAAGVLTASHQTAPGEALEVRLHRGRLDCEVRRVHPPTGDDGISTG